MDERPEEQAILDQCACVDKYVYKYTETEYNISILVKRGDDDESPGKAKKTSLKSNMAQY